MIERLLPRGAQSRRYGFFGPPPLLRGEDPAAFNQFLTKTIEAVKPTDFIEEIFVRDFVDLDWEIVRLRRLKSDFINQVQADKLTDVLERLLADGDEQADETDDEIDVNLLVSQWVIGDRGALNKIEEILQGSEFSIQNLSVLASIHHLDEIERIDELIMTLEARRHGMLRELDRHRQALGQQLRRLPEQIEDAEYKVVGQNDRPKIASQSSKRPS